MSSKAPRGGDSDREEIGCACVDAEKKKRMAPRKIPAVLETVSVVA
jgi:hypothetical protein